MKKTIQTLFLFLWAVPLAWAQHAANGIVRDANNEPIVGATIAVKGTNTYAVTDVAGQFRIEAKQLPFTLLIRLIGYKTQEIEVYEASGEAFEITLLDDQLLDEVVVTSRRREENAQDIPVPVAVVGGARAEDAGAFNVNRLKELVPSVQLYSSNPRNTGLSIRGLGTTFGLTNDGIDPGVGFYVDGVYYARTAATTLDFIDVERIEVLRGPQGTLFGKNTTAGAFNITTRRPSFEAGGTFELNYGNYGFIQARSSITGPLGKKLAGRLSFSGTQRDGVLENTATQKPVNDLNNLGLRGQLLYQPKEGVDVTFIADVSRQRPDGYAQVVAGIAPTQRAQYRQFSSIIAELDYQLPTLDPFARKIDHDTPWRSGQDFGGASVNVDWDLGNGTLTATSAWRFWDWDPSNDRDFTGLQALALSQAPSKHRQWSQEIRYAGAFSSKLSGVFGVFAFGQRLDPDGAHTEESGRDQWRFVQSSTSNLWRTPGLLDGYGIRSYPRMRNFSGAVFGQIDWAITDKIHLLPGLRFNYDQKEVDFRRETYGGLQTTDPALLALKRAVYTDQAFTADVEDTNFSGQVTLSYQANERINTFATFSTGFKPVGLNLGGLPTNAGEVLVDLAVIRPESVRHFEAGLKTRPTPASTLNLTVYQTDVDDYQTQVQAADLAVNRGYLANAEQIRVRGAELEGNHRFNKHWIVFGALSYTDGEYVTFTNAPPPLEETGGPTFKDISGGELPGISEWAGSLSVEFTTPAKFLGKTCEFFVAADTYYRSEFSSNPSPSKYLVVEGYALLNARSGFRAPKTGTSLFVWGRNLLDQDYFEQLLPGAGNAGHYAGVLGDPRTYGVTLRQVF